MATWDFSTADESNLLKTKFGKIIEKQFNMATVVFGRTRMKKDFVGDSETFPVVQSIGGGVSAGSLPTPGVNKIGKATINTKKLYAKVSIDRESMKAARTDEGAYVRFTKFPVRIATRSFNRNVERQITRNDIAGAGSLITGAASATNVSGAGTSGDPYVITFDGTGAAPVFSPFEEGDLVSVNSETDELEVTDVDESAATISLVGTSARLATLTGTGGFAATDDLYMQKSKDSELIGIKGALSATSGTLYGITVGRRWKAYQKDASAAALSTDLMNDVVTNLRKQCGEDAKYILCSFKQFIAFLDLLEDQKRYNLPARDPKFKATVSFAGVEYMSPSGALPVFPSRFMDDDKMYFLNDDHMELKLRPGGFEWFDEDGTVFLRESGDSYEARYGGYGEFFINPHFQAQLTNLA